MDGIRGLLLVVWSLCALGALMQAWRCVRAHARQGAVVYLAIGLAFLGLVALRAWW